MVLKMISPKPTAAGLPSTFRLSFQSLPSYFQNFLTKRGMGTREGKEEASLGGGSPLGFTRGRRREIKVWWPLIVLLGLWLRAQAVLPWIAMGVTWQGHLHIGFP